MVEHTAARRLVETIGRDFAEFDPPAAEMSATGDVVDGPLGWPGYDQQLASAAERSGAREAVLCGRGRIGDAEAVLVAFDFAFLGGSVGEAAGRRIAEAFERAVALRLPVVSLVASGGSRMQEGICALRQLQLIAAACLNARRERIPHITVLRDPTAGGMWPALCSAADVVLALPDAAVSFGGARVRGSAETGAAFTAEGKFDDGQVDRVVSEDELPGVLARLGLLLHPKLLTRPPEPAEVPEALGCGERAREYLDQHFDWWFELAGDRAGGRDPGMLCGIGDRAGRAVLFAAQSGTANTPAGFRTAARIIELADQIGAPVLTLVDTPGAANDAQAERAGLGPAMAAVFDAVARARVPVTTLVIGEGGSGGALALASPQRTWITADAYFAVIAPESAAAILKRDPADMADLAGQMRLRPQDLLELGVVRGIVR